MNEIIALSKDMQDAESVIEDDRSESIDRPWTLARLCELRSAILELAAKHGARNVRVFGSVARGDATSDSDVDLLVDFEAGRSLMDRAGLMIDLQELLRVSVDVATVRSLKPRIRDRVMREVVAL